MVDGRRGYLAVRPERREGSTARVNERLKEELCLLGRGIIHEPVPQHFVDILRGRKAGRRRERSSPCRNRSEPSL